jgi:hypothetical protein
VPTIYDVMIRCPSTQNDVETGLAMDPLSWLEGNYRGTAERCPHCGGAHAWTKADAFLREPRWLTPPRPEQGPAPGEDQ